jgi:hypothetical protein
MSIVTPIKAWRDVRLRRPKAMFRDRIEAVRLRLSQPRSEAEGVT